MCVKGTAVNPIHNILRLSFEPFTQDYHRNITNLPQPCDTDWKKIFIM